MLFRWQTCEFDRSCREHSAAFYVIQHEWLDFSACGIILHLCTIKTPGKILTVEVKPQRQSAVICLLCAKACMHHNNIQKRMTMPALLHTICNIYLVTISVYKGSGGRKQVQKCKVQLAWH